MKNSKSSLSFPIHPPFDAFYRNNLSDHPVGPHSHDGVELYYTLSDLPDVLLNDTIQAVPAGTLIIIPPFCVHQLYHESGVTYERYILSINSNWLSNVVCTPDAPFSYLTESSIPLLLTPKTTHRKEWVQGLKTLSNFSSFSTPEALSFFFHQLTILNKMLETLSPETTGHFPISTGQKRTNEIIAYIREHIYENISVSELATHFYLNPDYLSRLFKKHAHMSLSYYISLQKTATAQALLREGHTVAQVQEKLGYSSYAYFFKTFQKNTGLSPSKYREKYQ